jgi:GTP-binding protein LepA
MGFGFRCGFLGLLHLEIVQERLEREYDLALVTTAPSTIYRVTQPDGTTIEIDNPSQLPPPEHRKQIEEPYIRVEILTPEDYVGPLMELCQSRRGEFKDMSYLAAGRKTLTYDLPLAEVVTDFFDRVKSHSRGYASMEYQFIGYRENPLVRLDVWVNSELMDSLSTIAHRDQAYGIGRSLAEKLKELIPRQQFKIPIQAALGSRTIASEHIPPLRKDVLSKCYGGDVSRKKKLLQKQAKGKKRMKAIGTVDVPQEAFMAVLQLDRENNEK